MSPRAGDQAAQDADAAFWDLFSPRPSDDPYPGYARLRRLAPVHAVRPGVYAVTRWADCAAAMRHPDCLVLDDEYLDAHRPRWRNSPAKTEFHRSMLGQNADAHTRVRRLASRAFTPRRVEALRADVERLVERLLDEMAGQGAGAGVVDLQRVLSFPLPVAVIGRLLGVPEADLPWIELLVRDYSAVLEAMASPAQMAAADAAALTLREYFCDLVADRRGRPRDDLVTALATAGEEDRLPEPELISNLILILGAGFETTANLIGNGVMALVDHPEQAALLRADPSLAANTVEETLRYDAPVQQSSRTTRRPVRLADVTVPSGSLIVLVLGAANRDPEQFTDPDRFDVRRENAHRALGFGAGAHYCLGAALARLEATTLFQRLPRRFPALRPAGAGVRRVPGTCIRGYTRLPVVVDT